MNNVHPRPSLQFSKGDSFHEATQKILAVAQIFGIMPVKGITSKSFYDIKFSWKSIQSIYSIIVMISTFFVSISCSVVLANFGFDFEIFVDCLFYLSNFLSLLCFYELGRNWKKLLQHFNRVETKSPLFKMQNQKRPLFYQVKVITLVVLTLSVSKKFLNFLDKLLIVN